ncbi:hypothetical protein MMC08_001274 [Hypocenomyce scalaris]|nr:hypothetical protein [Hypocenomyce scalaris]
MSSYCNSILQALYYSVPFRDSVINYPRRSPLDTINTTPGGLPKLNTNTASLPNGQNALSPTKPKTPAIGPSARNPGGPPPTQKPEDKDSPEYKKKQAMLTGPILPMNYDNAASYGMEESLFTSLKDIFEAVIANKSRTGVVSPAKFLETVRKENEMFRTSMHQDAHEFLNLVLNEVVTNVDANARKIEADKVTDDSIGDGSFEKALATAIPANTSGMRSSNNTGWVHELFEGTLTSETKCLTCENVSQRDEAFLDLSVDLDQHSSVTSCLRKFSEEEMLCERNKFHCDRCGGLQEAEKRMKIKRLPKILALHLKRFKYTEDLQRLQKLFHRVVYPYHLRLFNTTDDAEDPDRLYELYTVVVHIGGGPYHGHYVSIVKTQDRGWLLFDDEMVEPVDKSYVRNFFGGQQSLACAYVLFYQETTLEAVKREQEAEGLSAVAQTATAVFPETVGLALKAQGLIPNGIHPVQSATSPSIEEHLQLDNLDKAMTAPPVAATSSQPDALSPPKGDVLSKKERAKAEKERKAAEKEKEKEEQKKRKDDEKRQAADIKAATEASNKTKAEEDRRVAADSGLKENGTVASTTPVLGGLSRFRESSKSIKKPKFWGSRDSSKDESAEADEVDDQQTTERSKSNRFSLRKRTSALLP